MNTEEIPTIHVCGYRTIEHLFDCIAFLNEGHQRILLKGFGSNVGKVMEIAHILKLELGVKLLRSDSRTFYYNGVPMPGIEIPIDARGRTKLDHPKEGKRSELNTEFNHVDYIHYCTYHLLISFYLRKSKELTITLKKHSASDPLLKIGVNGHSYTIKPVSKGRAETKRTASALYRSGLLLPRNWHEVARQLSSHDDVIAGLDTNMFYDCCVTRHILPILSLLECRPYVHTPNWLLFVVPATVMYELEEAANMRVDKGFLHHNGRMAFRALQEILELSEHIDIPGVSITVSGEVNPVLDTKGDIRGIREDIQTMYKNIHTSSSTYFKVRKSSSADMSIRSQYKHFLRQIDFHKGAYFLTEDKSNSALALVEGLHPVYLSKPGGKHGMPQVISPARLQSEEGDELLNVTPSIGSVIYELCVSHQEIMITAGDIGFTLACDGKGESMDYWLRKNLRMDRHTLEALLSQYEGRFNLRAIAGLWKKLTVGYENMEWPKPIKDAFAHDIEAEDHAL